MFAISGISASEIPTASSDNLAIFDLQTAQKVFAWEGTGYIAVVADDRPDTRARSAIA